MRLIRGAVAALLAFFRREEAMRRRGRRRKRCVDCSRILKRGNRLATKCDLCGVFSRQLEAIWRRHQNRPAGWLTPSRLAWLQQRVALGLPLFGVEGLA